jgi:arsenite methyltransferase
MSCPFHNKSAPAAAEAAAAEAPPAAEKPAAAETLADAGGEKKKSGGCPFHNKTAPADASASVQSSLEESEAHAAGILAREGVSEGSKAAAKAHFLSAYNNVAEVADAVELTPEQEAENTRVSAILMGMLGYTQEQLDVIGNDVWKMQGTGNPHALAHVAPGERVVDLGSGFGVDAFLASKAVGDAGSVIGVDLAEGEVFSAVKRAAQRRLTNVDFRIGDIEDIPVPDATVDCVISNGGFCLVPDKRKAFKEIERILKPGGRFSISCTASRKALDKNVNWPTCMLVFIPLYEAQEIVQGAGLVDFHLEEEPEDPWAKDSKRSVAAEEGLAGEKSAEGETARGARVTVHRGDSQYDHLKSMDMDEYFVRVNITGRKPS